MSRGLNAGINDLLTVYAQIAKEAYQWNPAKYPYGSHKSMDWVCSNGHNWKSKIYNRTIGKRGCPYCSGRLAIKGENDLATLYPAVAAEADGWDASLYTANSGQRMQWKCCRNHIWKTSIGKRATKGTGCPYCVGKLPIAGETDLASMFPSIAQEACGWDPSTVSACSDKKLKWICDKGHEWTCRVANRTIQGTNCVTCNERILVPGVNDLLSKFPKIAQEAHMWDPSIVRYGSDEKRQWRCSAGHLYLTSPNNRTNPSSPTSCPYCAVYGFRPSRPAWMYLMEREFDQQIGITNAPQTRISTHKRDGWALIEMVGPAGGANVKNLEATIKQWLKVNNLRIKGTHENWRKDSLTVGSLAEIAALAGVGDWAAIW